MDNVMGQAAGGGIPAAPPWANTQPPVEPAINKTLGRLTAIVAEQERLTNRAADILARLRGDPPRNNLNGDATSAPRQVGLVGSFENHCDDLNAEQDKLSGILESIAEIV